MSQRLDLATRLATTAARGLRAVPVMLVLGGPFVAGAGAPASAATEPASLETRWSAAIAAGDSAFIEDRERALAAGELAGEDRAWALAAGVTLGRASAVHRYAALATAGEDPERRILETLCDRALALALALPSADERRIAIDAIEQTRLPRFVGPLMQTVRDDSVDDLRREAAHALRRIGGRTGRTALRRALDDDDAEVRRLSAEMLARMKDASARRFLRREARQDDPDRALWAAGLLAKHLADRAAIPVLEELLDDPSEQRRALAVRALADHDDDRVLEPLTEALEDPVGHVRLMAARALAERGDRAGLPLVRRSAEPEVQPMDRLVAFSLLAQLDDQESRPLLRAALEDERGDVREGAAEALRLLGDPAGDAFFEEQEGPLAAFGALAGSILAGRRDRDEEPDAPAEVVVERPEDHNAYARAARMADLAEQHQLSALLGSLGDPEAIVRASALRALGRIAKPAHLDPIVAALADADPATRFAAVGSILRILDEAR